MTPESKAIESVGRRAMQVVARLRPGSFTMDEFLSHATGLNALANSSEVGPMLKYLTDNDVIRPLPAPAGQSPRWAVCAHQALR